VDRRLSRTDHGRLVDFALAIILLAVVIIGIIILLGPQTANIFVPIDNSL